jgi:hypothetical protein
MAVVFFSGFDLTTDADQFPFLTSNQAFFGTGRYGYGYALYVGGSREFSSFIDLKAPYDELFVEFDIKCPLFHAGTSGFFSFLDEDLTFSHTLAMTTESAGRANVQFTFANGATLAGPSTGYPIPVNDSWFHIGIYLLVHSSAGAVTVKVDTGAGPTTILDASGIDTEAVAGKTLQYFSTHRPAGTGNWSMDNLLVMDGTGAKDNTFKGPGRVYFQMPTGAGNYSDMTPSAGSNWQNVDEVPPDEDATYNQSPTPGHRDSFTVDSWASLIPSGLDIVAVQVNAMARKTDATAISLFTFLREATTDYDGSNVVVLGDSFVTIANVAWPIEFWDEDPSDSSSLTPTKLDAMEYGYAIPV